MRWEAGVAILCLMALGCAGKSRSNSDSGNRSSSSTRGGNGSGGSGATSGQGQGEAVSPEWTSACDEYARRFCDAYTECSVDHPWRSECYDVINADCADSDRVTAIRISPEEQLACADALSRLTCDELAYENRIPPECRFRGDSSNGSPCGTGAECQSGKCQYVETNQDETSCYRCFVAVDEGGACELDECALGLFCEDGVCRATPGIGDPCFPSGHCPLPLHCRSGSCEKPPGLGEACSTDPPYVGGCDLNQSIRCDPETGRCVAVTAPAIGEPCSDVGTCAPGAICSNVFTCEIARLEGEPCDRSNSIDGTCASHLVCLDGYCGRPPATRCD